MTICFRIDESGLLKVSIKSVTTGEVDEIEVKMKSVNMTNEERSSLALRKEHERRSSIRFSRTISREPQQRPINSSNPSRMSSTNSVPPKNK